MPYTRLTGLSVHTQHLEHLLTAKFGKLSDHRGFDYSLLR